MATLLLGDIVLRLLSLVATILLLSGCHRGDCVGGLGVHLLQGDAAPNRYTLDFTAHFAEGSLSFVLECSTEDGTIECEQNEPYQYSDPELPNPLLRVDVLLSDELIPQWTFFNLRQEGCTTDGICDAGPSTLEVRIERAGELREERVVEPEYSRQCRSEFGEYKTASLEIVLE